MSGYLPAAQPAAPAADPSAAIRAAISGARPSSAPVVADPSAAIRAAVQGGAATAAPQLAPGSIDTKDGFDFIVGHPEIRAPAVDPNKDPMGQYNERTALRMRAQSPGVAGAIQGVISPVHGATLGFGDEAASALAAGATALAGKDFGQQYDLNQEVQKQLQAKQDAEHPYVSGAEKIAGGALTAAAALPVSATNAAVAGGAGLGGRLLAGAVDAGGMGAVTGAGEADPGHRLEGAATGALTGAAVGTALYPVAAGVGAAVNKAGDYLATSGAADALGFSRGAVERITRAMRDGGTTPAEVTQRAQELGPEGKVLDLNPAVTGQAQGLARVVGPGQTPLVDSLRQRAAGAGDRITAAVDQNVGPAASRVQTAQDIQDAYRNAADPLYTQFRQTPVPFTPELEATLERIKNKPDFVSAARRLHDLDPNAGQQQFFANVLPDGTVNIKRVPNAGEWDLLKRAFSDAGSEAKRTGKDNLARLYGKNAEDLAANVDEALSPGAPSKSIYAQARAAAQEGLSTRDALQQGQDVFKSAISPEEVAANLAKMGVAQKAAFLKGARDSVGQVMGTARNDATAAKGLLASGWNQEKLETIVGPGRAKALMQAVDRERQFQEAKNAITGNSVTAQATAAGKEFVPAPRDIRVTDVANKLPTWLVNKALAAHDRNVYGKIGADAANILTMPLSSQPVQTLAELAAQRAGIQGNQGPRTLAQLMLASPVAMDSDNRRNVPAMLQGAGSGAKRTLQMLTGR